MRSLAWWLVGVLTGVSGAVFVPRLAHPPTGVPSDPRRLVLEAEGIERHLSTEVEHHRRSLEYERRILRLLEASGASPQDLERIEDHVQALEGSIAELRSLRDGLRERLRDVSARLETDGSACAIYEELQRQVEQLQRTLPRSKEAR